MPKKSKNSSMMETAQAAPSPDGFGLIWGVPAIARVIGHTHRATYHLLETNKLPAQKVGAKWCASEAALRGYFAKAMSPILSEGKKA